MNNTHTLHHGIELDAIDLSAMTGQNSKEIDKIIPVHTKKADLKRFLKHILQKIQENDSFLSFSAQVRNVNKILTMKYSSATDIADVILKDIALTTKLLKLVNSSFYGHLKGPGVATISEAMIILGTQEIRTAAASLKIYEFMKDIATIKILKKKTLKAFQRSMIARQIAIEEGINDPEAIQISAMLYDFGQYLVALFSPRVYVDVEIFVDEKKMTLEEASKSSIGISYSELGRYVAKKWKLPDSITHAMQPVSDFNIAKNRLALEDLQQIICSFSYELCHITYSMEGDAIGKEIVHICEKYKKCLGIPASKAVELLNMSREKIKQHAMVLNADQVHSNNS